MDFNEKEINEYVSSDEEQEEEKQIVEEVKREDASDKSELEFGSNKSGQKAGSMIFHPFKPGKKHAGMRPPSHTVQEIHSAKPLYQKNQRKLPIEIQ